MHRNEVVLAGRLSMAPTHRKLPSGALLTQWRLAVRRPGGRPGHQRSDAIECATFDDGVLDMLTGWKLDDLVEVHGALRRRWWRGASRYEIEVHTARRIAPSAPRTRSRRRSPRVDDAAEAVQTADVRAGDARTDDSTAGEASASDALAHVAGVYDARAHDAGAAEASPKTRHLDLTESSPHDPATATPAISSGGHDAVPRESVDRSSGREAIPAESVSQSAGGHDDAVPRKPVEQSSGRGAALPAETVDQSSGGYDDVGLAAPVDRSSASGGHNNAVPGKPVEQPCGGHDVPGPAKSIGQWVSRWRRSA